MQLLDLQWLSEWLQCDGQPAELGSIQRDRECHRAWALQRSHSRRWHWSRSRSFAWDHTKHVVHISHYLVSAGVQSPLNLASKPNLAGWHKIPMGYTVELHVSNLKQDSTVASIIKDKNKAVWRFVCILNFVGSVRTQDQWIWLQSRHICCMVCDWYIFWSSLISRQNLKTQWCWMHVLLPEPAA